MSLMDVIKTVTAIHRQIEEQQALLDGFSRSNRDNMDTVRSWLTGSAQGRDQSMLAALEQAERSLETGQGAPGGAQDATPPGTTHGGRH